LGWLSGWSYRKSHKITGSTAGAVSNYQIPITVHYGSGSDSGGDVYLGGKCRSDFGDIRFTDSDGVTLLPYWVEDKVDGNYAKVWVKVPSIPASPSQATIYIYYGNSSAASASSGNDTFVFFDDFDTLDTSKWDVNTLNGGSVSVSGGALVLTAGSSTHSGAGVTSKSTLPNGDYAIEASAKRVTGYAGAVGFFIGLTNKYARDTTYYGHYWCVLGLNYTCNAAYLMHSSGGRLEVTYYDKYAVGSLSLEDYLNKLVRLTVKVNNSAKQTVARFIYGSTDTTLSTDVASQSVSPLYVQIHYGEYGYSGYSSYCYWIAVRNLVDPEPVNDVWGAEESPVVYTPINVDDKGLDYDDKAISLSAFTSLNVDDKGLNYDDKPITLSAYTYLNVDEFGLDYSDAAIAPSAYTQLNIDDRGLDYGDAAISLTPPTLNVDEFGLSYVDKTIAVKPVAAAFNLSWLILLMVVAALVAATAISVKKYRQLFNPYIGS
jgi:hypothetical protein